MIELVEQIGARIAVAARPVIVGISGAQGSGKSTLCRGIEAALRERHGVRAATLSIDDLYLTQAERGVLARNVHPLLATRGVPGTHDVGLGLAIFGDMRAGRPVVLPRFDKAVDERQAGVNAVGVVDVLLFEGWCVGAGPQAAADLVTPVNALERDDDGDGVWRSYVNAALGGAYRDLFAGIGVSVMLAAPGFEVVTGWRREQEAELWAAEGGGMRDAEVARFVMHFERVTRHMLAVLPETVDVLVRLRADRAVVGVRGLG